MTLMLDARQRAMLEEMGIKLWLPPPVVPVEAAPAMEAASPEAAPAPPVPPVQAPPPMAVAPSAPVAADAPRSAPRAAGGLLRATAPQRLYAADGPGATGGWLVLADMPPGADGRHDAALQGEAGRLLDRMLRALRLHAGTVPVHLVRVWRGAVGEALREGEAELDTALDGWVAPLAPRLVLALGPLAAQRLLGRPEPLGRLRGAVQPVALAGATRPVVASYHPAYLLRNGADKARAWADLCLAAQAFDGVDPTNS